MIQISKWPIGVFASIDAGYGVHLEVARELGVPTLQLHAPRQVSRSSKLARAYKQRLDDMELTLTAVFGGFDGESYASIPDVAATVGLVPPATRSNRLIEMKQISDFAAAMGCAVIGLHLGFIPHVKSERQDGRPPTRDVDDRQYHQIVEATREVCAHARSNGQNVHLETGQETAAALLQFIADTQADNLYVNFDPANMILYGTGQPIDALRQIGGFVRSVHCKDAIWSKSPGQDWGREVPLGQGAVDVRQFLSTLDAIGYRGPLTIEREIPQEPERQKQEIGHAVRLLNALAVELNNRPEMNPEH
jgi:sugar phosphate isomerase/epimerase